MNRLTNISGCFIGLAVGDALGVPVEFNSRSSLKVKPVKSMLGYGTWNQPPGTWSDDSSLSFCLAEELTTGYDLNRIASAFVQWMRNAKWSARGEVFDIGNTTKLSLGYLASGQAPQYSGQDDSRSNGNGSIMRFLPAAIYFSDIDDETLFKRSKEISGITHAHNVSVLSCFILSKFVQHILLGTDKLAAYLKTISQVNEFIATKRFPSEDLKYFQNFLGGELHSNAEKDIDSGGFVVNTLEASIWSFLSNDSYSQSVLAAVNLGGDTDTTACVTGGLAGLYYGKDAIPQEWVKVLARSEDILELSERFQTSLKGKIFLDLPQ